MHSDLQLAISRTIEIARYTPEVVHTRFQTERISTSTIQTPAWPYFCLFNGYHHWSNWSSLAIGRSRRRQAMKLPSGRWFTSHRARGALDD